MSCGKFEACKLLAEITKALEQGVIHTAITRLLPCMEEEVSKDQPDCVKLQETLSVLSVKEEFEDTEDDTFDTGITGGD